MNARAIVGRVEKMVCRDCEVRDCQSLRIEYNANALEEFAPEKVRWLSPF